MNVFFHNEINNSRITVWNYTIKITIKYNINQIIVSNNAKEYKKLTITQLLVRIIIIKFKI